MGEVGLRRRRASLPPIEAERFSLWALQLFLPPPWLGFTPMGEDGGEGESDSDGVSGEQAGAFGDARRQDSQRLRLQWLESTSTRDRLRFVRSGLDEMLQHM